MQKFGLADNFWQKKYKVNYPEVWACLQLWAKRIQSELCKSFGLPTTSDQKNRN